MSAEDLKLFEKTRNVASDIIHKSTCQFFRLTKDMPKPQGSGVCLQVNGSHFILTAAHVVEKDELYLKNKGGMFIPYYEVNINKINSDRADDKMDVAILKLSDDTVEHLDGYYTFLSEVDLGINHQLVNTGEYLAYGFPSSMTKVIYSKKSIIDTPVYFTTRPSDESIYEKLDCKTDANIIIGYNKKKLVNVQTNQPGTGPDVYGMSGGGLWYVPMQPYSLNPEKKLISILTEWPVKDKRHIISTRIDVFTELLRKIYNLFLPVSSIYYTELTIENLDDNRI